MLAVVIDLAQGLADSDCEALRDGWVAQPVNTVTSLAYVLVGLWLIWKRPRRSANTTQLAVGFAVAVAFIGTGSVAFHGPQGWGARWLHDVPIVVTIAAIPAWNLARLSRITESAAFLGWSVVIVMTGIAVAVTPAAAVVLGAVAGVAAVASELTLRRELRAGAPAFALASIGIVLNLLGRTDAPLCRPDSVVQLHGVWHILTAAAILLWARWAFADERQSQGSELPALS